MEHAQPLNRPFPWRIATLVGCAIALATLAALVLTHGPGQTRPVSDTGRVPKSRPATPPVPLRPRSHLTVLVLNGNGVSGAAGSEATAILAHGYGHAVPTDAPNPDYPRSVVLYRPGWDREATRLGKDLGIPTVATLDGRVAPEYAHVPLLVILGAN